MTDFAAVARADLASAKTESERLAVVIAAAIKMAIAPLKAKIAEIEARGASVEYAGVYMPTRIYACGQLVTFHGGLWLALRDNGVQPGTNSECWKLIVKSGKA